MPRRIQRKRTKGWKMPEGAVYVGRPTKWGNPFRLDMKGSVPSGNRMDAIENYRLWLKQRPELMRSAISALRGRDLVCWCPLNRHCHADVLLEIANA